MNSTILANLGALGFIALLTAGIIMYSSGKATGARTKRLTGLALIAVCVCFMLGVVGYFLWVVL